MKNRPWWWWVAIVWTLLMFSIPVHNVCMDFDGWHYKDVMWADNNMDDHTTAHQPQMPLYFGIPVPFLRGR